MFFLDGHDKSTGQPYGPIQYGGAIGCPGVVLGVAHGSGYQTYVAHPDHGELRWQHKGPAADLAFDDGTTGIHGKIDDDPPYWQNDGLGIEVKGFKTSEEPAQPGDVPWLLLEAVAGTGNFAHVRWIQRVECSGGAPTDPPVLDGEMKSIPYRCRYLFIGDEHHVMNYDD